MSTITKYGPWVLASGLGLLAVREYVKWSNRPRRVVALGTSNTAPSYSYIKVFKEKLPKGSFATNLGYVGQGVQVIKNKGLAKALSYKPTDLIVETLSNDLASKRSIAHMQKYNDQIFRAAKAVGARVVFLGLSPHRPGFDTMIKWVSNHPAVDTVIVPWSLHDAKKHRLANLTYKGGHFTSTGHRKLGEVLMAKAF